MANVSPENIKQLKSDEIFVFGSNRQGIHGKGAARQASRWGARKFLGVGPSGQTYAIPTRDYHGMSRFATLPLDEIRRHVIVFLHYAAGHPELNFMVTAIGTGNAGYSDEQMAPLFKGAIKHNNIFLPEKWLKINLES